MKKFLIGNLVFILVCFAVIAIVMTDFGFLGNLFNRRVGEITVTYSAGFGDAPDRTQIVPLFEHRDTGRHETRERRTRMLAANTFTREGHTFQGWQCTTTPELRFLFTGRPAPHIPPGLTGDMTFVAIWDASNFQMSFNTGRHTVPAPAARRYNFGDDIGFGEAGLLPVLPGDDFLGWRTAANGGGSIVADGDEFAWNNNITLHGWWYGQGNVGDFEIRFQLAANATIPGMTRPYRLQITNSNINNNLPSATRTDNRTFRGWYFQPASGAAIRITTGQQALAHRDPVLRRITLFPGWEGDDHNDGTLTINWVLGAAGTFLCGTPNPTRNITEALAPDLLMPQAHRPGFVSGGWRMDGAIITPAPTTLGDIWARANGRDEVVVEKIWNTAFFYLYLEAGVPSACGISPFITGTAYRTMRYRIEGLTNFTFPTATWAGHDFMGWALVINGVTRTDLTARNMNELRAIPALPVTATTATMRAMYNPRVVIMFVWNHGNGWHDQRFTDSQLFLNNNAPFTGAQLHLSPLGGGNYRPNTHAINNQAGHFRLGWTARRQHTPGATNVMTNPMWIPPQGNQAGQWVANPRLVPGMTPRQLLENPDFIRFIEPTYNMLVIQVFAYWRRV